MSGEKQDARKQWQTIKFDELDEKLQADFDMQMNWVWDCNRAEADSVA